MNKLELKKIREYIINEPVTSKVYIGTDSSTKKNSDRQWVATFYTVVVIHKNGCNGCKIFGQTETEIDYNYNKKKPTFRLMKEVYKASETYLELIDAIGDRDVEIHLDLNPNKKYASSLVIEQAIGYIKGTCNVIPMVKPEAFAASYAADRLGRAAL